MDRYEMDQAAEWLRDEAERMEEEEPYAVTTIRSLRDAADHFDAEEADNE